MLSIAIDITMPLALGITLYAKTLALLSDLRTRELENVQITAYCQTAARGTEANE